jgi:hypothetical protein
MTVLIRDNKMNTKKIKLILLSVLVTVIILPPTVFSDYQIVWSTIDGGGGTSSGGQYKLTGTIGQPDADYSAGGNYELLGGFWPGGPLCFVDFPDFTRFADYWLETGSNLPADLNGDGVVNIYDLKLFVEEWLCSCPYHWPLR